MADNGRRSSGDPHWIECKKIVDKRDKKACQFERCLTAKEYYSLKPSSPKTIDRAHIFAASSHPELIYNPKNVISLSRFIHQRMDNYKNPLTDDPISLEEHYYWWYKIFKRQPIEFNADTDYELLLLSEIK